LGKALKDYQKVVLSLLEKAKMADILTQLTAFVGDIDHDGIHPRNHHLYRRHLEREGEAIAFSFCIIPANPPLGPEPSFAGGAQERSGNRPKANAVLFEKSIESDT
jgi:hypothetical protein